MAKNKIILALLSLLMPLALLAQGMSVESFRKLDTDMDAWVTTRTSLCDSVLKLKLMVD